MEEAREVAQLLSSLKQAGIAAAALTTLHVLFRLPKDHIPACNTRVMRTGRGFPWNPQIGVHPLHDGRIKLTPIQEDDPEWENEDASA